MGGHGLGAAEIADRLNLSPANGLTWRRRSPDLPEPIVSLSMGLLWSWSEVEQWGKGDGATAGLTALQPSASPQYVGKHLETLRTAETQCTRSGQICAATPLVANLT